MGVKCWAVVSCAPSVNTSDCFEAFFWKITVYRSRDFAFIWVIQAWLLRKSSIAVKKVGFWVLVGLTEVGLGRASNNESERHVLPAGLFSLLGHANLVALNMVDVGTQGPGWDVKHTLHGPAKPVQSQNRETWETFWILHFAASVDTLWHDYITYITWILHQQWGIFNAIILILNRNLRFRDGFDI